MSQCMRVVLGKYVGGMYMILCVMVRQAERSGMLGEELLAKVGVHTEKVDDEFFKMLNLCRDLLHSILPFVLTKVRDLLWHAHALEG